jgi:hypothetical protein
MSSFYRGRRVKCGALFRFANERISYDDALVSYRYQARGRLRLEAEYANDPDNGDFRADGTRGWKSHKYRRQWEHKVVLAEKREKNARKRASKRSRKGG